MEREHWIDAVRALACLLVITVHAPIPGGTSGLGCIAVTNYYAVVGVPLFFMISGALVLYCEQPLLPFLKKRLSRIALPAVVWTAVSITADYLAAGRGGGNFA